MLVGEQHKTRLKLGGTEHWAAINDTLAEQSGLYYSEQ